MEALAAIVVVLVIILGVWWVLNGIAPTPRHSVRKNPPTHPTKAGSSSGFDSLLTILAVGAAGYVALKFIGAVMEEVGKMPIDINGKRATIANAAKNDSFIQDLLKELVESRMRQISDTEPQFGSNPSDTKRAAGDVADMLRNAVRERMDRQGIPYEY